MQKAGFDDLITLPQTYTIESSNVQFLIFVSEITDHFPYRLNLMLVALLTLAAFFDDITVQKGDLKLLQLELSPGDQLSITSKKGILAVVFFRRVNIDINITLNGNFFHHMTEDKKACGFDFGNNDVRIDITSTDFGSLFASLISWPNECSKHRVITTLPFDEMVYSRSAKDEDYLLKDSQTICIWTAQPSFHEIFVEMHTEKAFDVLEYRSHRGIHQAFSGTDVGEVHSLKGLNYFVWRSDDQHKSDNFTLKMQNKVPPVQPFFKKTIRWPGEVMVLFPWDGDREDFYPDGREPEWHGKSELRELMPVFYAITVGFIVATIAVVVWCVCVTVARDDSSDPELAPKGIEGEYVHASGDNMPQPASMPVGPVDRE